MPSRTVTLTLPWLLAELNPNTTQTMGRYGKRRLHWRDKAEAARDYREWAAAAVWDSDWGRAHDPAPLRPPVHATVTFLKPDRRRRDRDNMLAAFKPAWDGMQDAGLIGDDSDDKLHIDIRAEYAGKPGGVRVVLTEAQPAEEE